MPAEQETCPSCAVSYYPLWRVTDCTVHTPDRTTTINAGKVHVATCTSCDEFLLKFVPTNDLQSYVKRCPADQLWPVPEQVVIEIVVQIFIDFENVRRREGEEPEMTDEEESQMKGRFKSFFEGVRKAAEKGGETATVASRFLPFFDQLRRLLPED